MAKYISSFMCTYTDNNNKTRVHVHANYYVARCTHVYSALRMLVQNKSCSELSTRVCMYFIEHYALVLSRIIYEYTGNTFNFKLNKSNVYVYLEKDTTGSDGVKKKSKEIFCYKLKKVGTCIM